MIYCIKLKKEIKIDDCGKCRQRASVNIRNCQERNIEIKDKDIKDYEDMNK